VFPEVSLMPEDPVERARARFWVKYEDDVLHPAIRPATFAMMMAPELAARSDEELAQMVEAHPNKQRAEELVRAARSPVDEEKVEAARRTMQTALDRLEQRLNEANWLGGRTYSLADVAAAPFIDRLEELNLSGLWQTRPALKDWIRRTKARPAYREAVPDNAKRFQAAYQLVGA
jgi:glutathione S-transferase